jgi:hypothetical protein
MKQKSIFGLATGAFFVALAASSPASAAAFLPPGNCGTVPGTNCLVFSDFNVYSLALLNFQAGAGPIGPGDPYAVSTNGTSLQHALVVGTGVNGSGANNSDLLPGGVVDNAYDTPSAQGGGLTNFQMAAGNQGTQGNAILNNASTTWDVNVAALMTFLNGGDLNFFFNLNQTNSKTSTYLNSPEDALGWLAVTVTDSTGAHGPQTAYLNGNHCTGVIGLAGSTACDPSQSVLPSISPGNSDILPGGEKWAYIHGQICVSPAGGVVALEPCAKNDKTNNTVNQNLGANDAAFGLYSDVLQTWLETGFYDKLSVDMRMAAETNGYEQLLIYAGNSIPLDVPEPMTLTLFGAGFAGAALLRRRKANKRA